MERRNNKKSLLCFQLRNMQYSIIGSNNNSMYNDDDHDDVFSFYSLRTV